MKIKIIVLSLVVVLVLACAVPLAVQANNTASMEVSFTVPEPPPLPPPTAPNFIINIPASIALTGVRDDDFVDITWVNGNLVEGDVVSVYIDGAQTFTDGVFYLRHGDGNTPAQRISCIIMRGATGYPPTDTIQGTEKILVAEFYPGHMIETASMYGRLTFIPAHTYQNIPGIYTGTLHFIIELVKY